MASPSNPRSFIILHKFKASCLTDSSAIETTVPSKSSSRQTALPSRDPRRKNRLGTQLGIAWPNGNGTLPSCMAECIKKNYPSRKGMYPESLVNWSWKPVSEVK